MEVVLVSFMVDCRCRLAPLFRIICLLSVQEPRERIISGTISYIKDLEQCIKDLEAQKEKKRKAPAATSRTTLSLQTPRSSVNATLTGNTVFFGIQSAAIPGLASRIVQVFETPNTNAQVLAASTSRMEHTMTVTITAVIGDGGDAERTIEQLKADLRKCLP
ncbi:transcription factor MUTE-like [Aristolochia californica]|uniref:transcription factor MUTE-like n=1 Tax=Aristolochia californica TaxID=171875 RepID=UPI0035DBC924